jgi:hypothetical protein
MKRREFFRLAAGAGLLCTGLRGGTAAALGDGVDPQAVGEYTGPFVVTFAADGGWDVTMGCDPKPGLSNAYGNGGVGSAGAIKYANVGNNQAFFTKHADRLLVINGVDVASNNHRIAKRHTWTGQLDDTHPHIAALVAGSHAPQLPLSFIAEGAIDETRGIVSRTRIDNANVLNDLSYPNDVAPADPADLRTYHAEPAAGLIADWRAERAAAMREQQNLPRLQAAMDNLLTVRGGANELALLEEYLPDPLATNAMRRKIQIALAAYRAGIAVSASFRRAGFDTHQNNDAAQVTQYNALLGFVDFLWDEAVAQGIQDQLIIAIGSDFARTPSYNARSGRDHWEVTSMMFMGAGIEGGRVVGGTDGGLRAVRVNPDTLQQDEGGVRISPKHIHRSLRALTGISDTLDSRFGFGSTEMMPLFG